MSKVLAVFGATGQQGGSVVQNVLDDAELSQQFKVRAITRDVTSTKAQQLKEKIEVVAGDTSDPASLQSALKGAHTVFAVTTPTFTPDGFDIEYNSAKAIADAAVAQGAKYLIFSTLPAVRDISEGKYAKVSHFQSKAEAQKYIRTLPIQSAFVSLGGYMENYTSLPGFIPQKASEDTWAISLPLSPNAKLPLVNAVEDTGKFVGAILAEPDRYEGKTFAASTAAYTMHEIVQALSKSAGKKVVYNHIPLDTFTAQLPPGLSGAFSETLLFAEEYGYYGADSEKQVAWAAENARGKLHTLEEFLEIHPLVLQ